jgi:chromosomal replication initiator protein
MSEVERVLTEQNLNGPMSLEVIPGSQNLSVSEAIKLEGQPKILQGMTSSASNSPEALIVGESENTNTPILSVSSMTGGPLGTRPVEEVWKDVIDSLNERFDRRVVSGWLKPLILVKIDRSAQHARVVIRTPNKFVAEHVHHHYRTALTQAFSTALQLSSITIELEVGSAPPVGGTIASSLQVGGIAEQILRQKQEVQSQPTTTTSKSAYKEPAKTNYRPAIERKNSNDSNLNPRYNFSNFVIGNSNQFAHAAALQVSENLGSTYNPLFIYGGVGLGKTHLVNCIGNAAVRRGKNVLMISSESFVNELISSLRANRMQEFKQKFRCLDLLIIDDVQFMIGKERTQEEFFHTFNELHQKHKQIILTSDKLPQELTGVEERLRTRFASGLSCDLQAPDFETRVAILSKKAEMAGVSVDREIAELLSERVSSNIRELEGALTRLLALSSLRNEPLSRVLAEEAVKGYAPRTKPDITTEYIQRFVSEKYGVSISDLLGKRRTQNIAQTRQLAMYLCRRLTGCSYPEIGALFGGRDHSTVIHAFRVMEERLQEDNVFKGEIDKLLNEFNS